MTDISKINRISILSIAVISLFLIIRFFFGGVVEGTEGTSLEEPAATSSILIWCYILLFIAVVASVLFSMLNLLKDKNKLVGFFISIGAIGALVLIGYIMSSGELLNLSVTQYPGNDPLTLKYTDTGLYTTYFLLGIAVVIIFYSEISKISK